MRTSTVLILLSAGCSQMPSREQTTVQPPALTREQVRQASQIVVESGSSALWRSTSARWVFDANGKCFGEVTHRFETQGAQMAPSMTNYSLPPETFQEVQRLLSSSQFLSLTEGRQPGLFFESSGSLAVICNGRKHTISFGYVPQECRALWDFINNLPSRGKTSL